MTLDPTELRDAIEHNDVLRVRDLIQNVTEPERRATAKALRPLISAENSAAALVRLWLAESAAAAHRAVRHWQNWGMPGGEHLVAAADMLAARHPPWLAEFVGLELSEESIFGCGSWAFARDLVRRGVIEPPLVPRYATKMLIAVEQSPLDALLADPGMLDHGVWCLFTVPGVQGSPAWQEALVTLSEQGRLDRGRLLDACLDAFTRDFDPKSVGWYASLHDRLVPSADEMAARSDRYLGLLSANSKDGVTVGQQGCERLLADGSLAASDFLAVSGPALLFTHKAVALAQLKLIAKIASTSPEIRPLALAAAAQAFGHERPNVQAAALRLISKHGIPDGPERDTISRHAEALAPAVHRDAVALGLIAVPGTVPVAGTLPPPSTAPSAGELLLPPLGDPAELVQLLAQLMEDPTDPLAVERAMAGAVRLAALPASERARYAAPLLNRAEQLVSDPADSFRGTDISADVAALTLVWGAAWPVPRAPRAEFWTWPPLVTQQGQPLTVAAILAVRLREAAALIGAGRAVPLLAEPEFDRGAISPAQLLDRVRAWPADSLACYDLEVALLRLTPEADESFWSAWTELHPRTAEHARLMHEQGAARLDFDLCAGQVRRNKYGALALSPLLSEIVAGHEQEVPAAYARLTRAPAGPALSHCWSLLTTLQPVLDGREVAPWVRTSRYEAVVAGLSLLCPWQPELVSAHVLLLLSASLEPRSTVTAAAATAMGCIAVAGHVLGQAGHLAVLTGLSAADPYVRIAAADAWTKASLDGRLDPELAAAALYAGAVSETFKLNRVAEALRHAAAEPVSAYRIAQAIFIAAETLIPQKPTNLHLLLELAAEIGATVALPPVPASIKALAAGRATTKLAAAARSLT